jgi:holo-[acyl-carrier protein] synthase
MAKLATGIDLIEIVRIQEAIDQHGERFLRRVFTDNELADARGRAASLAARFAAKEAVSKALGVGIGAVGWHEIEIRYGPAYEPLLHLHGAAAHLAGQLGLTNWAISLSHTHQFATAVAVASGD